MLIDSWSTAKWPRIQSCASSAVRGRWPNSCQSTDHAYVRSSKGRNWPQVFLPDSWSWRSTFEAWRAEVFYLRDSGWPACDLVSPSHYSTNPNTRSVVFSRSRVVTFFQWRCRFQSPKMLSAPSSRTSKRPYTLGFETRRSACTSRARTSTREKDSGLSFGGSTTSLSAKSGYSPGWTSSGSVNAGLY